MEDKDRKEDKEVRGKAIGRWRTKMERKRKR